MRNLRHARLAVCKVLTSSSGSATAFVIAFPLAWRIATTLTGYSHQSHLSQLIFLIPSLVAAALLWDLVCYPRSLLRNAHRRTMRMVRHW
jgi:hypothetical protein